MTVQTQSVALLAANPAFADIVSRTLEESPDYRVFQFASVEALTTFMRIAPVHVVLFDTEVAGASPLQFVQDLRANEKLAYPLFKTIVLTRAAKPFQQPILAAGVDVVLQKPVLPRQMLEAIDGLYADQRLVAGSGQVRPVSRPVMRTVEVYTAPMAPVDNVIPLFGDRPPR